MITIKDTVAVKEDGTLTLQRPELKAGDVVKVTLQVETEHPSPGRKLRQDWAGGLSDLAKQFTSVELQHKISEWRAEGK